MDFHVFTTHTRDGDDATPLQLISAAQLEHYQAIERAYTELRAAVQAMGQLAPPFSTTCTPQVLQPE